LTSLASSLADVVTALQTSALFQHVWVVQTEIFAADQFAFKVRAEVSAGYTFQVRIYYNRGHCDYAYQLFRNAPLVRWDNKEHFPHIPTYPHHYHNEHGLPEASPLTGEPSQDVPVILQQLQQFLKRQGIL